MKKVIYMGQVIEIDNSIVLIATDKNGDVLGVAYLIVSDNVEWILSKPNFNVIHSFNLPLSFDWTESLRRVDELEQFTS